MKDEMISRQAALDIYDDYNVAVENGELEAYSKHRKRLLELPSSQPGWIPTSERLPERYDNYLITTKDEDTDIGTFHPEFKQWSVCDADGFRLTDGVLAWCELPKPWEWGQDNGTDTE